VDHASLALFIRSWPSQLLLFLPCIPVSFFVEDFSAGARSGAITSKGNTEARITHGTRFGSYIINLKHASRELASRREIDRGAKMGFLKLIE